MTRTMTTLGSAASRGLRSVTVALGMSMAIGATDAPAQQPNAVDPPRAFTTAARLIDSLVRSDSLLSVAIAVVHDDRILWEAGFGHTSPGQPATDANTIFRVASVSKSLTGIAAMRLVQQGRLELDAPVRRYLGPSDIRILRGREEDLTARRLLDMTGGIPHLVRFYWADGAGPLNEEEIVRRYAITAFPPGESFHYSNLSFGVIQRIISRISGKPFDHFVRDEVFRPLGMTRTSLRPVPELAAFEATGFQGQTALPVGGLEPDGGAGFRSSAHDLALLSAALLTRAAHARVLDSRTTMSMWSFATLPFYSLGWWRDLSHAQTTIVLADGAAAGGAATIAIAPDRGIAAVALINRGTSLTPRVTAELLAGAIAATGEPPLEPTTPPHLPPELRAGPFRPDGNWLGTWCGTASVNGTDVSTKLDVQSDGSIELRLGEREPVRLTSARASGRHLLATASVALPVRTGELAMDHVVDLALRTDGARVYGYIAPRSTDARPSYVLAFPILFATRGAVCTN